MSHIDTLLSASSPTARICAVCCVGYRRGCTFAKLRRSSLFELICITFTFSHGSIHKHSLECLSMPRIFVSKYVCVYVVLICQIDLIIPAVTYVTRWLLVIVCIVLWESATLNIVSPFFSLFFAKCNSINAKNGQCYLFAVHTNETMGKKNTWFSPFLSSITTVCVMGASPQLFAYFAHMLPTENHSNQ